MLNLLRFLPGRWSRRLHAVRRALPRAAAPFGAEVLHAGDGSTVLVAEPGQSRDAVLLVRCPSRQALSDMVRDPAYGEGTSLRTSALQEAVLQATVPWSGTGG